MEILFWNRFKKESCGIWKALSDLFYPGVCEACGRGLVSGENYLCTSCMVDFPFADEAYSSGKEVLSQFEEHYRPEKLFSLFYYNKYSDYKNLIYKVKYHSCQRLGRYLGEMLGERIITDCHADCIVPVPLHPKRERERGFNQAHEIALGIGEKLRLEVFADVVGRVRNNVSQTGKNAAERLKNVEDIFRLEDGTRIRGRHVLLVDDVITTGATVGSCLRVLAGVGEVRFSLGCLAQTV